MRFDPRKGKAGENPLHLDSKAAKIPLEEYIYKETRYKQLQKTNPKAAEELLKLAKEDVATRWHCYEYLSKLDYSALLQSVESQK